MADHLWTKKRLRTQQNPPNYDTSVECLRQLSHEYVWPPISDAPNVASVPAQREHAYAKASSTTQHRTPG